MALRRHGFSYREIGVRVGLSHSRVGVVLRAAAKDAEERLAVAAESTRLWAVESMNEQIARLEKQLQEHIGPWTKETLKTQELLIKALTERARLNGLYKQEIDLNVTKRHEDALNELE